MFCSNLSQSVTEGHRNLRILGRCDLPWHEMSGHAYAGPGWYGRPDTLDGETVALSFWNNETLARDLYLRRDSETGTSVCVVGFHDPSSDKPKSARELSGEIEKASAQHFFPAISAGRLRVVVETYSGRSEYDSAAPSSSVEVDVRQLQPEFSQILQVFHEAGFSDALNEPGDVVCQRLILKVPSRKVVQKHGEYEHEALLLVRYASDNETGTPSNRLAMFRTGNGRFRVEFGWDLPWQSTFSRFVAGRGCSNERTSASRSSCRGIPSHGRTTISQQVDGDPRTKGGLRARMC